MMSESQYSTLKLIVLNIILIGLMIYVYPQFAESERFTHGAITIIYGISTILVVISAALICLKIYATKQLNR